jgi:hypothetical protein
MKRISLLILAGIVAISLFVGLGPRLLFLASAQNAITDQLRKILNSEISVENMQWSWLPLPHLSLMNAHITNEYSRSYLPHINIYPDWRMIFDKSLMPGKIQLEDPEILINEKISRPGRSAENSPLPVLNVSVTNGQLRIATPERYRDVLLVDHIPFTDINGSLKIVSQQARIDLKASSPYSKSLNLQGLITPERNNYKFIADCRGIKLHLFAKSFFAGRLIPAVSTSRVIVTIAGNGLQDMKASLKGILPGFFVKFNGHEVLLSNANADLALLKSGPLVRFTINDLEMQEPGLRLSGLVERDVPSVNSEAEPAEADPAPIWTLDLKGTDLDLSAIRSKVLTLWGESNTAQTVCNVVRGGKAASGAYRFSGRSADFRNLDAMTIEAGVLEADIHVPGAELDLTRASGPIMIKDSFLTGSGLSASLGASRGSNAKLLLDLSERNSAFSLDIDIDADLADLPPVLEQLVHHAGFQRELHKFKNVSGRASANLKLGDSLHNIITRVDVFEMNFSTSYDLFPETVYIDKGALQVAPQEVSWQEVKGRTGLQRIMRTSGRVSWQSEDVLLQIEETEGLFDGASLLDFLRQTGTMEKTLERQLSSLIGSFEVSQGTLRGPAVRPEAWEYLLAVKSDDLSFSSPLLPETVTADEFSATISDREISIRKAEINFLDQPIALKGTLTHKVLANWQGMVEFTGPVQVKLTDWLDSKGWLSERLRPNIPCRVENLAVRFQGETTAVSGIILPGLSGPRLPMARIDLENTPEHLHINELTFYAPGHQGSLNLDFQRRTPQGLILSWEGFVTAETIDALFQNNAFASGVFSGAFFEVSYFAGQPGATRYKGLLKAENLQLKNSDKEGPIILKNIVVNGADKQLKFSALDLAIGTERITGMGQLAVEEKGLLLDMDIASSHLTRNSLNRLWLAIKEKQNLILTGHEEKKYGMLLYKDWDITGNIGFSFDSYSFIRSISQPYNGEKPLTYALYDVHGDLQLAHDSLTRTEIFSSKLCDLDFSGFWYSDENSPQNFQLNTPSEGTFYLEDVLPCLGVEQDLVEGKFTLQANLQKESGSWQKGNIFITSAQGRILRMQTLSRIFKVVNITDLFEEQLENAGEKGFPYSQMNIDMHIDANTLIFDRAIIRGEGLNLFYHGNVDLDDYDVDLTLLIAPLKTFDTMISMVPLIGHDVMDKYESVVTIPVAIKGPIADPYITPMDPSAVSNKIFNLVKDTLLMPFTILRQEQEPVKNDTIVPFNTN